MTHFQNISFDIILRGSELVKVPNLLSRRVLEIVRLKTDLFFCNKGAYNQHSVKGIGLSGIPYPSLSFLSRGYNLCWTTEKATWGQKCWQLYVNSQDITIISHFKRSFLEAYSSVSFHKLPKTVKDNAYELNYYLILLEHAVRKD